VSEPKSWKVLDSGRALVLLSGGQDSTTCLAWALKHYSAVDTVGFSYGQRHAVELECRKSILAKIRSVETQWAGRLGEDHLLDLSVFGAISESALTQELEIAMTKEGLPTTFVPGRNLVFLCFAAIMAYRRGIKNIVAGTCETDFSGYPDCRDDTIKAMQVAINLGMARQFTLHTPLMWKTKRQTWELARELGGTRLLDLITSETHTCYLGDRTKKHEWGYGCGTCPACVIRSRGYMEFASAAA
jgi:7-cyano-7-deazaguanine synthase